MRPGALHHVRTNRRMLMAQKRQSKENPTGLWDRSEPANHTERINGEPLRRDLHELRSPATTQKFRLGPTRRPMRCDTKESNRCLADSTMASTTSSRSR